MSAQYACPGCGFLVFNEPPGGTFVICQICGWEDDNVQLSDPYYQGGANGICLADHQVGVLKKYPLSIKEHGGFRRDPQWRAVAAADDD